MRRLFLFLSLFAVGSASAAIVDLSGANGTSPGEPYYGEADGYLFDAGTSAIDLGSFGSGYGAAFIFYTDFEAGNDSLFVSRNDDNSFTFESADAWFSGSVNGADMEVIGHLASGGTISTTWVIGGFDPWLEPRTLSAFSGEQLTALEFVVDDDPAYMVVGSTVKLGNFNVTASVVPIPAAVWLFGSALAGLGWMRRKQIA